MHRYTCVSGVITTKVNLLEIALVEFQYCHYNLMLPTLIDTSLKVIMKKQVREQ